MFPVAAGVRLLVCFFYQAEDDIRRFHVTGVQTCALPIYAYGQEIARSLSWYAEGDTLYFSNHVNAGVRIGPHEYTVDVGSDSVMTRDPPQRVDDSRL